MIKIILSAAAMSVAILVGPSFAATDIIGQECKLWGNACKTTCEAKYPKSHIVAGGAVIGGGMSYTARQRANLIASCRIACMANYPICQ